MSFMAASSLDRVKFIAFVGGWQIIEGKKIIGRLFASFRFDHFVLAGFALTGFALAGS